MLGKLTIYKTCPLCGKRTYVRFSVTDEQYTDYKFNYEYSKEKPIQEIFPHITKYQRETIKSGMCRKCQKAIFGTCDIAISEGR